MTKKELENNLLFKNWFANNKNKIIKLCSKQKNRWRYKLEEEGTVISNFRIFTKIYNQFLEDDLLNLKLYENKKAKEKIKIIINLNKLIFEKVEKCF